METAFEARSHFNPESPKTFFKFLKGGKLFVYHALAAIVATQFLVAEAQAQSKPKNDNIEAALLMLEEDVKTRPYVEFITNNSVSLRFAQPWFLSQYDRSKNEIQITQDAEKAEPSVIAALIIKGAYVAENPQESRFAGQSCMQEQLAAFEEVTDFWQANYPIGNSDSMDGISGILNLMTENKNYDYDDFANTILDIYAPICRNIKV